MVVTEIHMSRHHDTPPQGSHEIHEQSSFSTFSWLERACFGLVAFVMQCEFTQLSQCLRTPADELLTSVTVGTADTIESIFGGVWTAEGIPVFVAGLFSRLTLDGKALSLALSHGTGNRDIAGAYSTGFLIQVIMYLKTYFESSPAHTQSTLLPPSLLPSLLPMDFASQYDEPDELGSATFLWSWLRDRLAGTPLAGLSSTSGRSWAGHYNFANSYFPLSLKLNLAPPPSVDAAANKVYFRGEGVISTTPCTLEGAYDTETGVVIAVHSFNTRRDRWHGVITPFGMVGASDAGLWGIWPQEWSQRSPAPAATVAQ